MQVFVNLISNAIQYTPSQKKVTVRLLDRTEKQMVRVEIEDTGPGISEGKREKIFDKFVRMSEEKQEGAWLGLPIAKDLVALHGGKV
jgi:two-component system, OmpR family, sensor histidine kinase TctE